MTVAREFDLLTAPLDAGTVMLEASAGTGKTYSVVGLLLRMLLEKQIESLDQALVVTFTVAATAELKNRLRAGLHRTLAIARGGHGDDFFTAIARSPEAEPRLVRALDEFDNVSIHTIHGFCKRLLDDAAFETREPFALEFAVDPVPMLHVAAADALRSCYSTAADPRSALLAVAKLGPTELVRQYTLWQRYPDVALTPDPADAAAHLEELGRALAVAGEQARADADAIASRIGRMRWRKGEGLYRSNRPISPERLVERIAAAPELVLPELRQLAPEKLDEVAQKSARKCTDHPFFATCDAIAAAFDESKRHLRAELLRRMHARIAAHKRKEHTLGFQDLLARTHAALQDPERRPAVREAVRSRYRVALIDEFQDTDPVQYEIFADCFAERPLFLIGDPKQSIYGFRGADLDAYLAARNDAEQRFTLGTNFRTADGLVRAVQATCKRPGAFVLPEIDLPAVAANAEPEALGLEGDELPPLVWRYLAADKEIAKSVAEPRIARDVAAEISRLFRAGVTKDGAPLAPRDIAILTRTNAQATSVQDELRAIGIVSAIGKAGDVLETDEVGELEVLMRAILQPRNLQRARAAMGTRIYGLDAAALHTLNDERAATADSDSAAGNRIDEHLLRFERWRLTWVRRGFVVMMEQLFADRAVVDRMLAIRGGERRLTNVQQLTELLHRAEHEGRLSPEGLLEFLVHERLHRDQIDYELRELRLESDEDAVQILTVHGSKGLEYEVVFCPFLWDGRTPSTESIAPTDTGRELVFELKKDHPLYYAADLERLAEDARLVYVALTRAKRRCYVHLGALGHQGAGSKRSALCWMLGPLAAADRSRAGGKKGHWYEDWVNRHKEPAAVRSLIEQAVEANPEQMALVEVATDPAPEPVEGRAELEGSAGRRRGRPRVPRRRPWARGLHSFSSIVADAPAEIAARDTTDPARAGAEPPASAQTNPTGIFAFARGAAAGNCLHEILEHLDWETPESPGNRDLVERKLRQHALLDPGAHSGPIDSIAVVRANVLALAAARAGTDGPTIQQLAGGAAAAEWDFTLPAIDCRTDVLAGVFERHGGAIAKTYAPRLAALPERALRGHLVGFVDLLAEHDGRYWIVDWKSNHLGDAVTDYGNDALAAAMHEHDYVLQYHLYVLALHRLLGTRLPDYDYDRHFGGVCYAFLRGAVADSANGMFCDRPERALVAAMDEWVAGALRSAGAEGAER